MLDKKVWKRVKVTFINPNISCDVTLGISTFQKSSNTITKFLQSPWPKGMVACWNWPVVYFQQGVIAEKAQFTTVNAPLFLFCPVGGIKVSLRKGPANITPWGQIFWDLGKFKLLDERPLWWPRCCKKTCWKNNNNPILTGVYNNPGWNISLTKL